MDMTMKTKDVSEQLGVNPTTIQRWMKFFGIRCETNEHGHYFFTNDQVHVLKAIQQQLQEGKKMKEIDLSEHSTLITRNQTERGVTTKQSISSSTYDEKIDQVMQRVADLEYQLTQKADEVVSYQLLKHRSEIENMMKLLERLESRIDKMEEKIQQTSNESLAEVSHVAGMEQKRKWKSFKQIFSF